jgi:hypothetical protein
MDGTSAAGTETLKTSTAIAWLPLPLRFRSAAAAADEASTGSASLNHRLSHASHCSRTMTASSAESCFCNAWRRTAGVYGDCRKAARKDARLGTGLGRRRRVDIHAVGVCGSGACAVVHDGHKQRHKSRFRDVGNGPQRNEDVGL